jgi:hypothetical protein
MDGITLERLAQLVVIGTGICGFSLWAVGAIVIKVIRGELGPLVDKVEKIDNRLVIVETILKFRKQN